MAPVDAAAALRELLYVPIVGGTHKDIGHCLRAIGLDDPNADGTKAERVCAALGAASVEQLRRAAQTFVDTNPGMPADRRIAFQDLLWHGIGPVVPERTRRAVAAAINLEQVSVDPVRFEAMLDRWWNLGSLGPLEGSFSETDTSIFAWTFGPGSTAHISRKKIRRHVFDNPGDWSATHLFDELGAFAAVDRRFGGFLEDLVSHQTFVEEDDQRWLVDAVTPALRRPVWNFAKSTTRAATRCSGW